MGFVEDLKEPDAEKSHGEFPNYIRTIGEHLNTDGIEKQFGKADVYDGTQVIMNSSRIPGSRSKGKDNPRDGKGARRKGKQGEENLSDGWGSDRVR